MEFLDDALVYDEKVASAGVFEKQRVRWLEAQVNHVRRFFDADMKKAQRTILFYNKFFQNLLLPRVLTLVSILFFDRFDYYSEYIQPATAATHPFLMDRHDGPVLSDFTDFHSAQLL